MAANLKAKISLDTSAFSKGISLVNSQARAAAASISKIGSMASAALAGLTGIGGISLAAGIKQALDFGSSLSELSARTGAPVKDLVVLQQAFKDSGVAAEAVGPFINRLQKALTGVNESGEPTNKMFARLGLKMGELRAMAPLEQFQKISKSINGLADPAERAAAAIAIFGRSGGEMLQAFSNASAFGDAAKAVGSQAEILQKNAEAFDRVSDVLNQVGTKLRGFFVGIADSLLPALQAATEAFAGLDLAGLGQKVGSGIASAINVLVNAFKSGQLGELIWTSIQLGTLKGIDFLIGTMRGAANAIQEVLGQAMAFLIEPDLWNAMLQTFIATVNKMAEAFVSILEVPLRAFQTSITYLFEKIMTKGGGRSFMEIFDKEKFSFAGIGLEDLSKNSEQAADKAAESILKLKSSGIASVGAIMDAFKDGFAGGGLFDEQVSDLQEKLGKMFSDLNVPAFEKINQEAKKAMVDRGAFLQQPLPKFEAASNLEKVGAIIPGGAQQSVINFARSTAENTKAMIKHLQVIASNTSKGGSGNVTAVFAQ